MSPLLRIAVIISVSHCFLAALPASSLAARSDITIAVVDILGSWGDDYVGLLQGLGYDVTAIPRTSRLDVLEDYDLVVLPEQHADATNYVNTDSLAGDYLAYVEGGGGLWVSQPNPHGHIGHTAEITWVPYALTLTKYYDLADCPPRIVDANHCVAEGLPAAQFSMPADTATEFGPEWHVIVEGTVTGNPSVFVGDHGAGRILVELGNPSAWSYCPISAEVFERYADCAVPTLTATQSISWGAVKAMYR